MGEKLKSKKGNNQEKIKWYRTRWFWGVVVGVAIALSILLRPTLDCPLPHPQTKLLYSLPIDFSTGITALPLLPFDLVNSDILWVFKFNKSIIMWLIVLIYYAVLLYVLYQTFNQKRVKIKYPIILIIISIITYLGNWIITFGKHC